MTDALPASSHLSATGATGFAKSGPTLQAATGSSRAAMTVTARQASPRDAATHRIIPRALPARRARSAGSSFDWHIELDRVFGPRKDENLTAHLLRSTRIFWRGKAAQAAAVHGIQPYICTISGWSNDWMWGISLIRSGPSEHDLTGALNVAGHCTQERKRGYAGGPNDYTAEAKAERRLLRFLRRELCRSPIRGRRVHRAALRKCAASGPRRR